MNQTHDPRFDVLVFNSDLIVLIDLGPWDKYPTITNGAESVVRDLIESGMKEQRLFYIDSEANVSELTHDQKRFTGFASLRMEDPVRERIQAARSCRS